MALVVSILADDFDALSRRALEAARIADVLELRLDRTPDVGERELGELIARLRKPTIVAVNGPSAYGTFAGTPAERRALLVRAARAGAAFVDVDWREAEELGPLPNPTRRIVSRHERALVGSAAENEHELRTKTRPGDLRKLVVEARDANEALEVLALMAGARGDLIAFASGSAGSFSRIVAPILGSPFTYAAVDAESATAPGQLAASAMRAAWPANGPSASTRILAVIGNPIAHSISPRVHTRALREAGIDAVFVALASADLARTLAACHAENWRGFAITAPNKEAAFALAKHHDAASLRARASNTLVRAKDGWSASNTDVVGVRGALLQAANGAPLADLRALVLGAGGAARSALVALEGIGAKCTLAARNLERSTALAAEFGAAALAWEKRAAHGPFDIVVQCTPAGASEELLPEHALTPSAIVVDAVYRPLRTPLIETALRRGARVSTGDAWFTHQAERQFELLTGKPAPQGVIADEVVRALA